MNDTPVAADDCMKLLDAGHVIAMRKCGMGSYFAVCAKAHTEAHSILNEAIDKAVGVHEVDEDEVGDNMPGVTETDDFTPSKSLYRLTEKATTGRIA